MSIKDNLVIDIKDLSKVYDGQQGKTVALSSVDLQIYKGDFVVLLGPSGCGKTTLLNIIAGYNKPSSGQALMHDKEIVGPGKDRGVVFQSTNLYPWLSVRENIEYGLKLHKQDQKKIKELSDMFLNKIELLEYENHYPFELSGGMKQRVALVRTLINNPEILLMDEPFGALDAMTRVNMQRLLRDLWHEGDQTFFLITHDIDEALFLGSRVLVMSKDSGQIIKEYKLDYKDKVADGDDYVTATSPKYLKIKKEILELIA